MGMGWDGMGLAGWQAGRPVSVCVLCLCDCVTRGGAQCWSRRACQSGMLWLASCQTGNLVMVVTTQHTRVSMGSLAEPRSCCWI